MDITNRITNRGFRLMEFKDSYAHDCSLQKSSLATEDAIWLGIDDANPLIMASDALKLGIDTHGKQNGWMPFPVPEEVLMTTRMHLTREQVAQLLPLLQHFVDTGELPQQGDMLG